MAVSEKSKKELIEENNALRLRLEELERNEAKLMKADELLRESEFQYRTTIDSMRDAIHVVDADLNMILINEKLIDWSKELGIEVGQAVGRNIFDLFPFLPDKVRDEYHKIFDSGKALTTVEAAQIGGREIFAEVRKIPICEAGKVVKVITIIRDITEKKLAEDTIKESEEKFRSLAEQSPNMIFINKDGRIIYTNKKCEEITGYKREEFYCPDFNFLNLIAPESMDLIKECFKMHMEGREVPPYEYTIISKAGERIEVINSSRLIQYEGGNAILGVITDITERKQQENLTAIRRDLAIKLGAATELEGGLSLCLEAAMEISGMDCGGIYLVDDDTGAFKIAVQKGLSAEFINHVSSYDTDSDNSRLVMEGKPVYMEHAQLGVMLDKTEKQEGLSAIAVLPVLNEGRIIGCMNVASHIIKEIRFRSRLALETIATQIGSTLARLKMEQALKMSELRFRSLIEQTTDAVFCYEYDPPIPIELPVEQQLKLLYDGVLVECNDVCAKSYGAQNADEVIGSRLTDLFGTESGSLDKLFMELIEGEYRIVQGEGIEKLKDGTERYYLNNGHGVIEDGKLVRVWGTFRDITEQKEAQTALAASEQRFRKFFENEPEYCYMVSPHGIILEANSAVLSTLGYTKEELLGKPVEGIYAPESSRKAHKLFTRWKQAGEIRNEEMVIITRNGDRRTVLLSSSQVLSEDGELLHSVSIQRDITDRKQAQMELKESRQRLQNLIENMPIVCFTYSRDGHVLSWNSAAEKVYGYTKEEAVGSSAYDLIVTPMTKDATDKVIQEVFNGKTIVGAQWQDRDKTGTIGWRMGNTFPLFNADGSVYCGVNMNIDITESKQAEDALRQSEEKFRSAFKHAAIGRAMAGLDGYFLDVNSTCCEMLGYSEQELLQMAWMDVNHPADLKTNLEYVSQLKEGKIPSYQLVIRAIRKDGHTIWLDLNVVMVRDSQGRPLYMLGDVIDITEHKRAKEQMLIKDDAIKSSINAIALARIEGNLTYVNKSFLDMWGYQSEQEVLGRRVQEFWQNSNEALNIVEKLHNKGKDVGELTAIRKDGSLFDVQLSANMVFDDTGKALCMMASFVDVTERNRLEEAYRSLVDNSLQGLAIIQDGRMVFLNEAFSSTIGYKEQELLAASPEQLQSVVHPEDRELVWKRHRDRLAGKRVPARYEFRFVRKDGNTAWVEIFASEIEYRGRPAIQAAYIDITERKKAEEALRQSEERLKILFESAPDAIYLSDLKGNLVDGNKAAEQIIGYKKNELLGKSFVEMGLLSSEQVLKVVANLKKIAKGKPTGPDEFTLIRKDGSKVSVEIRAFPVRIEDRILSLSIAHDISARKKTEKKFLEHRAQLKSLASELSLTEERERHRLATSLHDQIGQALVISRIKLQALHASVSSADIAGPLEEACENLDRIIQDTRTLTFDLSSPILYELGFEAAVSEWLEEQITKKHGIKTQFKDDGRPKPLDDDIRILLFRNVRELLINIVKHARAKNVTVSIRRIRQQIYVCVEDDGIGFDHSELSLSSGFGIFSIRERLEQLTGHIEIESERGRGTRITMTAPLKCNKISGDKKRKSR